MAVGQRGGDHRAGGVVAGDSDHRDVIALRTNPVADNVAGVRRRTEPFARRAGPVQQRLIPAIAVDVDQLGGGGVGIFPVQIAGQAEAEIVGDQQGMGSLTDQLRLLLHQRAQLIKRVKRQKLNAAAAIDFRPAQLRFSVTQQALGAVVTIGDRQPDALALLIQQDIIYPPGIDADTVYQNALLTHFLQPAADLAFQAIYIPAVEAVYFLQTIGEAMNFAQRQGARPGLIAGEHHPPAGGA